MSQTTFIYALCEPKTRTIRYIGKANRPAQRLSKHRSISRKYNSYLGHWLDSLHIESKTPSLLILKEVLETEWQEWERLYIRNAAALGFKLVNGTLGGEGGAARWGKLKPETIEKMRANRPDYSGEKNPMFGKKHAWATLTKMSAKHKNNTSGFVGVYWRKDRKKWAAEFRIRGKPTYAGIFTKIEDAVFARALALDNRLTNRQNNST